MNTQTSTQAVASPDDDFTDNEVALMEKRIFAMVPGMTREHDSDLLIESDFGETYIKCMSDHGVTDDDNGIALRNYVLKHGGTARSSRLCSMLINNASLRKMFLAPAQQQLETIAPDLQKDIIGSFWSMLRECEGRADDNDDRVLKHQVEGYYRQWNEMTNMTHEPIWVRRAKDAT